MGLLSIQPTYAPTNATYNPPATEVELRRDRLKCGQCPDCGLQTHDFVKKGLFGFGGTISVPLTNVNVTSGRCLKCKPLDLPAVPVVTSFVPAQFGDDVSMLEDADDAAPIIKNNQIVVPSAPLQNHSRIVLPGLAPDKSLTTSDNVIPGSDKYCFAIVGRQFTVARRNANYGVCALASLIIVALIAGFSVYAVGNEKDTNHITEPTTASTSMDHEPTPAPSSHTQDKTSSISSFSETTMSPFNPPTTKPSMSSSTLSTQTTKVTREQSIREAIEMNVLQRDVKFDELPQNDNRILALNWLLDDDQMQLNPADSNLNQRYILALLSFEWGSIPNLDFGSIPEDANDSFGWLSGEDECKWWLVACNENGEVRVLHLDGSLEAALYLEGTLPPEIGQLSQLTNLDLQSNVLSGTLPSEIGNLNELTVLFLGSNSFKGTVPSEFGNLKELIYLDLGFNMLTGSLPSELGNLKKLTTLNLDANKFTGTFPWNETSKMTKLCLNFDNSFTGVVPAEINCVV